MRPLVSIVIPTKNRKAFLAQAIDSCLRQTYQRLEIIVVDGASDDGTQEYMHSQKDARLVYVRQPKALGFVSGLNDGFKVARGAYLTWSSDDDLCAPSMIATLAAVLENEHDVDFVYSDYWIIDPSGKILCPGRVEGPEGLSQDNYVGHCFLYRRAVYEKLNGYRAEAFLVEDYEYWLRVRASFNMKRLNMPLYYHRHHPGALTSVYGVDQVQAQVARVRRPFIPAWLHHFHSCRFYYGIKKKPKAFFHACAALWLKPWHGPSWRLLALSILPSGWVKAFRKWRASCAA